MEESNKEMWFYIVSFVQNSEWFSSTNSMLLMLEVHFILYQQDRLKRFVWHLRNIAQQIT